MKGVHPNAGHRALAEMEAFMEVYVVTQNIDDLHERAGSSRVLHLHGEIFKKRSAGDLFLVEECREDIPDGALAPDGHPWRPDVVWFGEDVPRMGEALDIVQEADYFLVVGTSLGVYPAASLIGFAPREAKRLVLDPNVHEMEGRVPELAMGAALGIDIRAQTAAEGLPLLLEEWRERYG
jgi:NAD-dependent deacetylase